MQLVNVNNNLFPILQSIRKTILVVAATQKVMIKKIAKKQETKEQTLHLKEIEKIEFEIKEKEKNKIENNTYSVFFGLVDFQGQPYQS